METNGYLKKKKILYIHRDGQGWGGAQQGVIDLIQGFKSEFGEIVFVGNKGMLISRAKRAGVRCYILPFHRVFMFPISFLMLSLILKKERPDIVHSNHRYTSVLAQLSRKVIRERFVTLHTARSVFYSRTRFNDMGDWIVAISQTSKKNMVEQFNYPPNKIDVIYNAIELPTAETIPNKEQHLNQLDLNGKTVIGIVGNLVEAKGHHYLFQALRRLPDAIRKRTILLVAGEGHLADELEMLSRKMHIKEMVKFLGYFRNIGQLLRQCDFLVIPSTQEGGSRALIEGHLCGVPSIAFGLDFALEFIQHNQTGLIVPAKDVNALAQSIQYYVENPDIAKKHGQQGRDNVRGKYTRNEMIKQYRAVYQKLLTNVQNG